MEGFCEGEIAPSAGALPWDPSTPCSEMLRVDLGVMLRDHNEHPGQKNGSTGSRSSNGTSGIYPDIFFTKHLLFTKSDNDVGMPWEIRVVMTALVLDVADEIPAS